MEQTESKASSMSSVSEIISFIERNPITRNVPFSIPGNPPKATPSSSHWDENRRNIPPDQQCISLTGIR
jgi:hypothetical protein